MLSAKYSFRYRQPAWCRPADPVRGLLEGGTVAAGGLRKFRLFIIFRHFQQYGPKFIKAISGLPPVWQLPSVMDYRNSLAIH
jgi:hypothetical protein